jgi:ATP-dependent DNA ligase
VIVGFVPGRQGFRRLLVAAAPEGPLHYVASVHSGFTSALRVRLHALLTARVRARPVVSYPTKAVWVEPELYCQVRFLEWTPAGLLRGASFHRLLAAPDPGTPHHSAT